MFLHELVIKTRSFRRFHEDHPLSLETLKRLVNTARLTASASNLQPLRYVVSTDPTMNARIFPCLAWAGYLKDWDGPEERERPTGYVVVLGDKQHAKTSAWDLGIAAQTILLEATEIGLGGCMIGSIQKAALSDNINVPDGFEILLVIALGKPKEKVVLEELSQDGDIRYWRDDEGVHHVPKRDLASILVGRHGS